MQCQKVSFYAFTDLFFKGGLQVNWLVSHHELLGNINLGSRLVGSRCKLYFTNHQTASVPKTRKKRQENRISEGWALYMSLIPPHLSDDDSLI